MSDLNIGSGTLTAGGLIVPGLNLSTAFIPIPIAQPNEWVGTPTTTIPSMNSMLLNGLYLTPVAFPDVPTLIGIGVNVTALAGGTGGTYSRIRYGMWLDDGTGKLFPANRIPGCDGEVSVLTGAPIGWNPTTIDQVLPAAGTYWLGAVWQSDQTAPTSPTVTGVNAAMFPLTTSSPTPAVVLPTGYLQASMSGSLPSPAVATRTGVSLCPRVMVKHQ
jgi:hypothetical protein